MAVNTDALLRELPRRRWFGGKQKRLEAVELVDTVTIDEGEPPLVLALARVRFADGDAHLYHLPLLVEEDGGVRDAFDEVDRLRALGPLMAHGQTFTGEHGSFHFGGPGLDPMAPPGAQSARSVGAEQSNTSVVLDDSVIVKLFRRVEPGPNPELELNRALTNEGFEHIPPHVGEILYEGTWEDEPVEIDLAIAQTFVRGAVEGWPDMLRHLRSLYEQIHEADLPEDLRFLTEERGATSLESAEKLGEATAAMHIALAREELSPELAPEPVEPTDLKGWSESARSSLRRLLRSHAYGVGAVEEQIEAHIDRLQAIADAGLKMRIHGDLHLGQVIRAHERWLILDFEGEPMRSLDVRRAKQSPLRDVAGMLRSFSYAAAAAMFEMAGPDSPDRARFDPWAETWESEARDLYLQAYLRTSHEGRFLPADRHDLMVLLDVFEIDKALYEIGYEQAHRPDWIEIPLRGIRRVIERGEGR